MDTRIRLIPLTLAAVWLSLTPAADAATIGYWRFEGAATSTVGPNNDRLDDYSGNGLTLGISTGTPAPTHYTLPGSGPGSAFSDPIPKTGAANDRASSWGNTASDSGGGNYFVSDVPALTVTDFTIEAFINKELQSSRTQYIASQFRVTGSQRSWAFGVAGTSDIGSIAGSANDLFLLLSDAGSDANVIASGIDIAVGDDYFVAASFDQSNLASGVTFYVRNLTASTPIQIVTAAHPIVSLHNSTTEFRIGSSDGAGNPWTGWIDEVRLSDSVLSLNELLLVPTPAALPAGLALMALAGLRRRR